MPYLVTIENVCTITNRMDQGENDITNSLRVMFTLTVILSFVLRHRCRLRHMLRVLAIKSTHRQNYGIGLNWSPTLELIDRFTT